MVRSSEKGQFVVGRLEEMVVVRGQEGMRQVQRVCGVRQQRNNSSPPMFHTGLVYRTPLNQWFQLLLPLGLDSKCFSLLSR